MSKGSKDFFTVAREERSERSGGTRVFTNVDVPGVGTARMIDSQVYRRAVESANAALRDKLASVKK
ncbi:MAG TPA: hypothetical protein VHD15_18640 [Hyphomicrobiales bacterium]|nr:hypothetical protein [Hyphomicrobiales bacterium]